VSAEATLGARQGVREFARTHASTLLAAGTAIVLGLLFLGRKSIWVDESFSHEWSAKTFREQVNGDHWLYYATLKSWRAVAGDSEFAMRLPAVFAAGLAAAALVVLGRRLLDPLSALLAGLLFATNPFVVTWSQQARGYTIFLLLTILSTIALERALERATIQRWGLYAGLLGLTMVWQVFGVLLVPVHVVAVLLRRRDVPARYPVTAFCAALLLFAPWLYTVATRDENNGETTWRTTPDLQEIVLAIFRLSGPVVIGFLLAVIGASILIADPTRRRAGLMLTTWAGLPIALILAGLAYKPVFLDRYVFVTSPAFALLGAAALARLRFKPVIAITAVALAVVTVTSIGYWYQGRGIENWRSAVALAQSHPAAEVVVTPFWAMPAYDYYAGRDAALEPHSKDVLVIAEGFSTAHAIANGRAAIGDRPYTLISDRAFGDHLRAQHWRRRG
jgi:mannosyltransferase